jgi:hypothetical protein
MNFVEYSDEPFAAIFGESWCPGSEIRLQSRSCLLLAIVIARTGAKDARPIER